MNMNIAVILAGGNGSRFGADRPKQFVEVFGKPILAYTIEVCQNHPEIDAIEVVCNTKWQDFLREMVKEYDFNKVKWIADGGDTFQESLLNGIYHLDGIVSPEDTILVQSGVSPLVTEEIISDCIRVSKKKGNAISANDFLLLSGKKNSKKSVSDAENYSDEYIDRDSIVVLNSPNACKYGYIKQLYDEAIETGVINEVDPHFTTLMYKMGRKLFFSKGSQKNIKITTKEDIELLESYLLWKQNQKEEKK